MLRSDLVVFLIDATGALHHVICRGIERRKIYWEDSDRDDFLQSGSDKLFDRAWTRLDHG